MGSRRCFEVEQPKVRKKVSYSPPRGERDKDKDKLNTRIVWARGLTNDDICGLLQMKLLESRARHVTRVGLLNELVHEIKHRLGPGYRGSRGDGLE
jgi:hypothetical protein